MKKVKLLALIALMSPAIIVRAEPEESTPGKPKVIALKFHADWCGSCKAMGDVFEELQAKYDNEPVLYVVLDQTREYHRQQSTFMAKSLGLGPVWDEYGGKTGFILLVDGDSSQVIHKLGKHQSLKEMGASLQEAVRQTSGR